MNPLGQVKQKLMGSQIRKQEFLGKKKKKEKTIWDKIDISGKIKRKQPARKSPEDDTLGQSGCNLQTSTQAENSPQDLRGTFGSAGKGSVEKRRPGRQEPLHT